MLEQLIYRAVFFLEEARRVYSVDMAKTRAAAEPGEAYQAFKALLRVQARMVAELEDRTEHAGVIPPTWLDLLLKLSHAPGKRLRMSDLAEWAVLSRGGVTRLVTRIEAGGLLRREACEDDGRGAFAVLTRAGSEAVKRAEPVYRAVLADCFAAHLTPAQARATSAALQAIIEGNGWATLLEEPASGW